MVAISNNFRIRLRPDGRMEYALLTICRQEICRAELEVLHQSTFLKQDV